MEVSISSFTWTLYKSCKRNAPELVREVNELHAALQEFEEETNSSQASFLAKLRPPLKDEYKRLVGECITDLQELNQLIKYRKQCLRQGDAIGTENAVASLLPLKSKMLEHASSFTKLQEAIETVEAKEHPQSFSPVQQPSSPVNRNVEMCLPDGESQEVATSSTYQHAYVESVVDSDEDTFLTTPTEDTFENQALAEDEEPPFTPQSESIPDLMSTARPEPDEQSDTEQRLPGAFPGPTPNPATPKSKTRQIRIKRRPPPEIHQATPIPSRDYDDERSVSTPKPSRSTRVQPAESGQRRPQGRYYRYSVQQVPQRPAYRRAAESAPARSNDGSSRWSSAATCGSSSERADSPPMERGLSSSARRKQSAVKRIAKPELSTKELKEQIQREEAARRIHQRRVHFEDESRYGYSNNPFRTGTPQLQQLQQLQFQGYADMAPPAPLPLPPPQQLQQQLQQQPPQQQGYASYIGTGPYPSPPYMSMNAPSYLSPHYQPPSTPFSGFPFPPPAPPPSAPPLGGYFNPPPQPQPQPHTHWYAFSPPPTYNGPFASPPQQQQAQAQAQGQGPATHPTGTTPTAQFAQFAPQTQQAAPSSSSAASSSVHAASGAAGQSAGSAKEGRRGKRGSTEGTMDGPRYFIAASTGVVWVQRGRFVPGVRDVVENGKVG